LVFGVLYCFSSFFSSIASFQWQQMKLIGHRGVGAEKYAQATPTSTRRTHIQENTVLSFVTASKSGADFIEFDVQVHYTQVLNLFILISKSGYS
jgi:glycerophosphoryl diester phosphodiesterase